MQVQKPYLVGITGGSAMGKTHFLNSLKKLFSTDELCVISQDNYYKLAFEHQLDPEGNINFDLPECIDLKAFAEDLEKGEVTVYAKLPNGFKIPTPVGNYNPDWAIVFDNKEFKYSIYR